MTTINTVVTAAKRIYPVKEAAEQLGMTRTRLYELIKAGAIESTMLGRRRVVTSAALDRFARGIDELSIADADTRAAEVEMRPPPLRPPLRPPRSGP